MRIWPALTLFALAATGCHAHHIHSGGGNSDGPYTFPDGAVGYYVLANAGASLPGGDIGYIITANDTGGYRITWTDTLNSNSLFDGSITADQGFDPSQTFGYSGNEQITMPNNGEIDFSSTPGSDLHGVDLVSISDPIILTARVNGSRQGFDIVFTGAYSGSTVAATYDPVAFAAAN